MVRISNKIIQGSNAISIILDAKIKSHENIGLTGMIKTAEIVDDDSETNDFFTIVINEEELYASVKNLPWNLCEGDRVVLTTERNEQDEQVIVDIKPKRRKDINYGRVTTLSSEKGYAVFEDNTILLFSLAKHMNFSLEMHDEYKYEVIESDQKYDNKKYDFRVLILIEKVATVVSGNGISFRSESFKISLNSNKEKFIEKYILVKNRSDKPVKILSVKSVLITPDEDDLLKLKLAGKKINYTLTALNGYFKIFFEIKPSKTGCFRYKLIVQFNGFEETNEFSVEIVQSCVVRGPKMSIIRFVDIEIGDYPVPSELNEIDYSKAHVASEMLTNLHPVLAESINANNYVEKMQLGIFLEEIAMQKAFANYRIKSTTFETVGEFLRLVVKEVAEKRPSIGLGDKVIATDPFRSSITFEGSIHKIENESILCKFHFDFHSTHRDKTFSIDFTFSRTSYRRQQFALEKVTNNDDGLGFNFLFPSKIESKRPQVDAMVDAKGILHVNEFPRKWYNNLLNKHQKNAVVMVLRGENRPLPYLIFGCPGSGKLFVIN